MTRTRNQTVASSAAPYFRSLDGVVTDNYGYIFPAIVQTMVDEFSSPFDPQNPGIHECTNLKAYAQALGSFEFVCTKNSNPSLKYILRGSGITAKLAIDQVVPGPTFPAKSLTKLKEYCLQQAVAGIDTTPYAFAEDLATWRETLKFIRRPMGSIADLALDWNKTARKIKKTSQVLRRSKLLANAWTEYRFGLRPLVNTTFNALLAYHERQKGTDAQRRSFGRSRFTRNLSEEASGQTVSKPGGYTWLVSGNRKLKVTACVYYRISNPVTTSGWQLGLRANDAPSLMWDLLPLSFVIDRMLDVGSAIRGFMNLIDPSIEVIGGCYSERSEINEVKEIVAITPPTGYTRQTLTPSQYAVQNTNYIRSKVAVTMSSVVPSFMPGDLIDSSTKLADLAALTVQRLKG